MAVITATEVTVLTNISATAGDTTLATLIPLAQERLGVLCNRIFDTGLSLQDPVTFATATVTTENLAWASENVAADDDIFIAGSYRNDGYYGVQSATGQVLTIYASTGTLVDELSGASVLTSVINWPESIKPLVAAMIKYDYDDRAENTGVKSESIGDYSVTYGAEGGYGYPQSIIDGLQGYTKVKFV